MSRSRFDVDLSHTQTVLECEVKGVETIGSSMKSMNSCVSFSLGLIFSIISALCFPALTLLFGRVFKEFIDYNLAVKIKAQNSTSHDAYYCDLSNSPIADYFSLNSHQLLHMRIASLTFTSLGICLLFFTVAALSRSLSAIAAAQIGMKLRHKHFSALLSRNIGWFSETDWLTELPSALLLEGVQVIEVGITFTVVLVQKSVTIVACLVIAFLANWKLALVLSVFLPFLLIFSYALVKAISIIATKEQDALMFASSVAEESLQSIETVKMFEGEHKETNRYIYYVEKANEESRKIVILTVLMVGILYFFILTLFTIGSWLGFRLMLQCECEASDIILVTSELVIVAFSISELLPAIGDVVAGFQSATLLKRVTSNKKSHINSSSSKGLMLNGFDGALEFINVIFSYSSTPDINVLNGMSFKIFPGQVAAIVGQSGCGKSTIIRLISRFYDTEDGQIKFDDVNSTYLSGEWLRSQMGFVMKETGLFEGSTIADNIGYGIEDRTTMEQIIEAAKTANAHKFITDIPFGYSSVVGGKDGVILTQAQTVLISLARALIRDPKILIIDLTGFEFDRESEQAILDGISQAREGRTMIIVPHKLSTFRMFVDFIMVINNGQIAEVGTHISLVNNSGIYRNLYLNETSQDEFYDILEKELKSEEVDSNLLFHELSISGTGIQKERASEKSPLLPKLGSTETEMSVPHKRTALSLYKEILTLVLSKAHWYLLSFALFLFILAGAALSSFFILFEKLGEHFNSTNSKEMSSIANIYSPLFSILGLVVMVLNCIGYIVLNRCEENLRLGIRQKTFRGLLSQKLKWFHKRIDSIDRLSNMLSTDASNVSQVLSIRIGSIAWSVTAVLGALSASFVLCWPIGLTLLPSYVWLLIAGYLHCKFTKHYSDYRNALLRQSTKMAASAIKNIHTILHFGMADMFIRNYSESLTEPLRCDIKHAAVLGVIYGMSQMLIFLFIGFGYLIGTFLILSSSFHFTYSDILTSLFTIWFASQIFKGRFDVIPGLQDGAISLKKILKYFPNHSNTKKNKKNKKNKRLPVEAQYSLQLTNIWGINNGQSTESSLGSTPPSTPQSVISVNPGQTLAVVGPNMSHDNTVLSLVEQIDSSAPNTLLLDGVDMCELDTKWLQRQIGIVSRHPVLFNISVMDNIRYGVNHCHVSREEVVKVAKSVGVHEVLQSLPMGYDSIVGFNGYKLSMEERFSVALARALIRNPKILLMDDTPAKLEKHISEAMSESRKGRTSLVITNKLSTLQRANSVAVLYRGRVLEQGTHTELMERKRAYFMMNEVLRRS